MSQFPRAGRVEWIGLRPARKEPMRVVQAVFAHAGGGLEGDRYKGSGKRGVTLIQAEHLPAIASLAGLAEVRPALLRRNIVVSGLPLIALVGRRFAIAVTFDASGLLCRPCDRMQWPLMARLRGHAPYRRT
jgi:MOSC domain-containing protein YiiM